MAASGTRCGASRRATPASWPRSAGAFTGSADLYGEDGRSAYNSVNFITCHDGFTLCDLVSYDGKHNECNGENNQDGANDNHSWNCGWKAAPATPPFWPSAGR